MSKSSIINRNFFRILRAGAFDDYEVVESMSAFKWKRLIQIGEVQHVLPYISRGFAKHAEDSQLTYTESLRQEVERISDYQIPSIDSSLLAITEEEPQLTNFLSKRKLKKLRKKEQNSDDCSEETLQILNLIIHNVNQTLSKGISLQGIIEMGRFLRIKGDKVDFVKLEQWLHQLGITRLASLQGSILIEVFRFDMNEIPFMQKEEKAASKLTQRSLTHTATDTAENWHFRMRTNGMVENNSRVLRRNLRRSMRYMRYNPVETISSFMANFARSLSEIEE